MPPQKRSRKNIPVETDHEEHHHVEGNEISLTREPSNIESASRLLIILVIMTMQLGRINALNEMCAGSKVK
jgi:hypothetical protein